MHLSYENQEGWSRGIWSSNLTWDTKQFPLQNQQHSNQTSQTRLNSRSVWSQHQKVAGSTQDHEETDSSFPHLCHNWNQSKGGPRSASACGCFSLFLCVVKLWTMNLSCVYNYGLLNMVGRHWLPGKPHSREKETNPETLGEHSRTKLTWSTQAVEKIP